MIAVDLVVGGSFIPQTEQISDDVEGFGLIKIQKQQLYSILKFLDYSQDYTKFQTGIQEPVLARRFTDDERETYMKTYEDFKKYELDGDKKLAAKHKEQLGKPYYFILSYYAACLSSDITCYNISVIFEIKIAIDKLEEGFSYDYIASLRHITINKSTLKVRMDRDRKIMEKDIKNFENSKSDGILSIITGGRSDDQKAEDKKAIK